MEYILLDTNILIYREGEKKLDKDILTLSRLLMDSMNINWLYILYLLKS